MFSLLLAVIASFLPAILLTPICRDLSIRFGWVDKPDHKRKVHAEPIPRIGGIPIVLAYAAAFGALLLTPLQGHRIVEQSLPLVWRLVPAAIVILAAGLLDDLVGLRPWQKLLGQVAAAALVCWAGIRISIGGHLFMEPVAIALTILWLVGCANAFNLIDGVDGLAAGVGLFATLTTLVAAFLQGNFPLALAVAPLAGALLGFLRYNFNPASIFLGDSGSLFIGFLLGCYGVIWSQKSATLLGMTAPLMALSVPLLDTMLSVARRFLRRQPIFGADRNHIHHRLLERGFTPRRVALLLYGGCALAAAFSLLQSMTRGQYAGPIIILFCAAAWMGIQHLGYVEFNAARRLIGQHTFRNVLNGQLRLRSLEEALDSAQSIDECWLAIRSVAMEFGFTRVAISFNHTVYEERTGDPDAPLGWTLHVPLSKGQYVELGHAFDSPVPMVIGPFAEALRRKLEPKLAMFELESQPALG